MTPAELHLARMAMLAYLIAGIALGMILATALKTERVERPAIMVARIV